MRLKLTSPIAASLAVFASLSVASTPANACNAHNPAAPELASSCPKHPPLHIPNWGLQANLRARAGGTLLKWSDPATWVKVADGSPAGRIPGAADIVLVPSGSRVLVNGTRASARIIAVSGEVRFARTGDNVLSAGTILVNYDGTLDMGVPARIGQSGDPITGQARLRLATAVLPRWYTSGVPTWEQYGQPYNPEQPTAYDPRQYSGGLIVLGRFTAAGRPRDGFARLAQAPIKGQVTLDFASVPRGWQSFDRIAVPDTRSPFRRRHIDNQPDSQTEIVAVAGTATASSLSLRQPLQHAHAANPGANDLLPHAANLTRNVIVESANYTNPAAPRAHVFVNGPARVDIDNVAFVEMGRTLPGLPTDWDDPNPDRRVGNQKGRYSLHFHHLDGPFQGSDGNNGRDQYTKFRSLVTGCAFENSYRLSEAGGGGAMSQRFAGGSLSYPNKWQIALHGTTRVLVSGNVLYGATGAGVATEDGNEGWNEIVGNFALNVPGQLPVGGHWKHWTPQGSDGAALWREDPALLGSEGVGFWLSGSADMVWNNVAADCGFGGILLKPSEGRGQLTFPVTPVSPREDWVRYDQPEFNHVGIGWDELDLPYAAGPGSAPWQRPLGGNEVYGAMQGIETWGRSDTVLRGARVWNCHIGLEPWRAEIGVIEDFAAYGDPHPLALSGTPGDEWGPSKGINNRFHPVAPRFKRLNLQEFGIGMVSTTPGGGIWDGRVFELEIADSTFACSVGLMLSSDLHYKSGIERPARTRLINCRFDTPPLSRLSTVAILGRDCSEDFRAGVTTDMQLQPNAPDEVYVEGLTLAGKPTAIGSFRFFFNGQKAQTPYPMQADLASGWRGGTLGPARLTNGEAWAASQNDADGPKAWCGSVAPWEALDNPILDGFGFGGLLLPQAAIPAPQAPRSELLSSLDVQNGRIRGQVFQNVNKHQKYKVALYVDGLHVATLDATEYRDSGWGRCQFTYAIPHAKRDGAQHHVRAEVVGENHVIADGQYTFPL